MKKKEFMKKAIAVLAAGMMLLGIVGCGTQEADQVDTTIKDSVNTTVDTNDGGNDVDNIDTDGTDSVEAEPVETVVTDMIGREVTVLPGSYTRVVCVGAGALRMYTYIGDVSLICGVEDIDNVSLDERPKMFDSVARPYMLAYSDQLTSLPSCGVGGPAAQAAEAEKILACNPDIVISEFEDVEKEDALQEQLGVPVITLKSGAQSVFDDSFAGSMELLGLIFNKANRAAELIEYIAAEKEIISSRTAAVADEDKPSVYICGLGNWGTTNHLMTAEQYVSFKVANVKNALENTGAMGVQPIEEEKFVAIGADIDIMIIDAAAVKNIKPLYAEDSTMFDTVKAWNDGEVYLEMAYNAYYNNYELVLINTWYIAKCVYPDLFSDIDINAKMDEVTTMFQGVGLADKINAMPSSFGGYQKIDTATFFQ